MKANIKQEMLSVIEKKIAGVNDALKSLAESRDMETKSSAGDKFETGRAMVQEEQSRQSKQLMQLVELQRDVFQLNVSTEKDVSELASLVITNKGNYFISVALGRIVIEGENYFALSLNSPIGKLLKGTKVGDTFAFQKNKFEVLEIH